MNALAPTNTTALSQLTVERARDLLAQSQTVDEVKDIRDYAVAMEAFARQKKAGVESQNLAIEIVLRAERRMGEILKEDGAISTGGRPKKKTCSAEEHVSVEPEKPRAPTLPEYGLSRKESAKAQKLAEIPAEEFDRRIQATKEKAEKLTTNSVLNHTAASSHDGDAWQTPEEVLDLARKVLGVRFFDLDPASSREANERVRARKIYTKADNSLGKEWNGVVWLNPPYSNPAVGQFAEKLLAEFEVTRVAKAAMIVNSSTETGWYQSLLRKAIVFLPDHRIDFMTHGRNGQTRLPQTMFFLGVHEADAIGPCEEFGGVVLQRCMRAALTPEQIEEERERERKTRLVLDAAKRVGRSRPKIKAELGPGFSDGFIQRVFAKAGLDMGPVIDVGDKGG